MTYSINPELAEKGTIWANRGGGSALEPLDPGPVGSQLVRDDEAELGVEWGPAGDQKFISPVMDLTQTGLTTAFTNGSKAFVITRITFIADEIDNYSGGATVNVGYTGPLYDMYAANFTTDPANATGLYNGLVVSSSEDEDAFHLLPAHTALIINVTGAATADVFLGRYVITGFTV
jgi:hypothetical protein